MIKKYLSGLIAKSYAQNNRNILSLLEPSSEGKLLDLGCDDGHWTVELAQKIGTTKIYGADIVPERMKMAEAKNIQVATADLNAGIPYPNEFFDVIHANQVIEHLFSTDTFITEIYRMLKPGGYAIISTENLSSWHNIFALVLGFQPFSMANYSIKGTIGNPMSLWNNIPSDNLHLVSWQHNRLFSYFGLKDLAEKHGFKVEKIKTAGYYPMFFDLSILDKVHGHWIAIKIRK